MQNDELLTLAQAGKEVGLSPVTMRAYTTGQLKPVLPSTTIGRAKVVTRQRFDQWKAEREKRKDK